MEISRRVGMVAGEGNLPVAAAEAMEKEGCELLVLAIEGAASPNIETPGRSVIWIPFGKIQAIRPTAPF